MKKKITKKNNILIMKKIIALIVLVLMVLCVASCDFGGNTNTNEPAVVDSTDLIEIVADTMEEVEEIEADSLIQCVAITKAGTQCQRLVKYPDTLCFQHYKMK